MGSDWRAWWIVPGVFLRLSGSLAKGRWSDVSRCGAGRRGARWFAKNDWLPGL